MRNSSTLTKAKMNPDNKRGLEKQTKYILHSPYHPIHPGTGTFSERDFVFIFRKNPESYKFIMKKCRPYIHDKKIRKR